MNNSQAWQDAMKNALLQHALHTTPPLVLDIKRPATSSVTDEEFDLAVKGKSVLELIDMGLLTTTVKDSVASAPSVPYQWGDAPKPRHGLTAEEWAETKRTGLISLDNANKVFISRMRQRHDVGMRTVQAWMEECFRGTCREERLRAELGPFGTGGDLVVDWNLIWTHSYDAINEDDPLEGCAYWVDKWVDMAIAAYAA